MDKRLGLILIGGGGFLGSAVKMQVPKNASFFSLGEKKNATSLNHSVLSSLRVEESSLSEVAAEVDHWKKSQKLEKIVVLNLAGPAEASRYQREPAASLRTLFNSLFSTFELMKKLDVDSLIHLSTGMVYGTQVHGQFAKEEQLPQPSSLYASAKLASEELVKSFSKETEIPSLVFRPANLYGPTSPANSVVGRLVSQLRSGLYPSLEQVDAYRDFIHVDDAAQAVWMAALSSPKTFSEVYNLASGRSSQIADVVRIFQDQVATVSPLARVVSQPTSFSPAAGDLKWIGLDPTKLREALQFSASISLEQGIAGIVEMIFKNQPFEAENRLQ